MPPDPTTSPATEHVTPTAYRRCHRGADTELHTVADGGHTWTGSPHEFDGLGSTTHEIDANTPIRQFFRRHHR
ncbi:hypothetical protein ACFQ1I_40870 [Kitasatospora arboriphila]